jgi:tRNA threonylcarbamoyladenosine biosynthesis protein TsaB
MAGNNAGTDGGSSKILLAIDTSTERGVIALADEGNRVLASTTDAGRRHGRDLIPRLNALLDSAGIEAGQLSAIAVGLGPGSYTGLRVGVMAAKTLAYVTGAPLVGFNSLHAIGRNAPPEAQRVSVIADAQRGELYVAELIRPAAGAPPGPSGETRIEAIDSFCGRLETGTVVLGPALDSPRIRSSIPAAFLPPDDAANGPRGECLIDLAREILATGRHDNPWLLEPLYLRRSAAEDQWDARLEPSPR